MRGCQAARSLLASKANIPSRPFFAAHSLTYREPLSSMNGSLISCCCSMAHLRSLTTAASARKPPSTSITPFQHVPNAHLLISSLGSDAPPATYVQILSLLQCSLDPPSVLRLMPSIVTAIEAGTIEHTRRILRFLLPHIGRHRMLALVPTIVDCVVHKIDDRLQGEEMDHMVIKSVERLYDTVFSQLRFFLERPARPGQKAHIEESTLPMSVRREVLRLTSHFMDILSRLPSPSDFSQQHRIPSTILDRLFSRRYMTVELRGLLLSHCWSHKIDIPPEWWRHCILSAVAEGNQTDTAKYRARKRAAELKIATEQEQEKANTVLDDEKRKLDRDDSAKKVVAWERRRQATAAIQNLILARGAQPWPDTLQALQQYLHPPTGDRYFDPFSMAKYSPEPYHYAWSMLSSGLSADNSIHADALTELIEAMPGTAIVGHTITPVMHGLIRRGQALQAWEIWRDLVARERETKRGHRGLYVDRVTVAVATEACHAATDLQAAVTLVDTWALRPWMPKPDSSDMSHSLTLDTQNINVLLHLCKRDGKPSIAFRLWAAALPRYGVYLDAISLNLLLDTARFADINHEKDAPDDMFRARLRQMAEEFGIRRQAWSDDVVAGARGGERSFDAYDAAGFAKGSAAVLLDPPGSTWRDDYGPLKPWQMARNVFRQVLFGNWPHLAKITSPLDTGPHGPFASFSSFFGNNDGVKDDDQVPASIITRLPSPEARFTHIIPNATTFQSYIALLGYYSLSSEIPLALCWMRGLDIRPSWGTMCLALLHICEGEGPRRWVRGWGEDGESALVRDEEVMRRWLQGWLGVGEEHDGKKSGKMRRIVPTEEDVAAQRRYLAAKRERLTA